jgi:hypothetical protein
MADDEAVVVESGRSNIRTVQEQVDLALDTVRSHLRLVNFKSAFWGLASPPDAEEAQWDVC